MLKYDSNPQKYKIIYDNKLGFTDLKLLMEAESDYVNARNLKLLKNKNFIKGNFNIKHLQKIHKYLFQDIYPWAGEFREVDISKGNTIFCLTQYFPSQIQEIESMIKNYKKTDLESMTEHLAKVSDSLNALHPFREGNGRSKRAFTQLYADSLGFDLDYSKINAEELKNSEILAFTTCNLEHLNSAIKKCLNYQENKKNISSELQAMKSDASKKISNKSNQKVNIDFEVLD